MAFIPAPLQTFAHEVYVLNQQTIDASHSNPVSVWQALQTGQDFLLFIISGMVILGLFALAFYLGRKPFFWNIDTKIDTATEFVPALIRIAFGASLLFSAWHGALYGPEIPLGDMTGGAIVQAILWVSGAALVLGIGNRLWAVVAGLIWVWVLLLEGPYMLTYINYLGEAIAIWLLPCQRLSIGGWLQRGKTRAAFMKYERYSMPVARILFGLSLLFTAVSTKFMDTALPLAVVEQYHLTRFFPFEPLFIVLGAALIEVLVALLYIAGFLQRFTTVIFLIFMTLSIVFFKESVWPHYLLIALGIGVFLHKPDIWSLDRKLAGKPVKARGRRA